MKGICVLLGFVLLFTIPFNTIYADSETAYDDIDWFKVISYFVTNPFLALELMWDMPNADKVYNTFAEYRNQWMEEDDMPTDEQVLQLVRDATTLKASEEFCSVWTVEEIEDMIVSEIPYDLLTEQCTIPDELDALVREQLG